jgi:hypothetical protein
MNITEEVNLFRETARHLWNTYLRWDKDYNLTNPNLGLRAQDDTHHVFSNICRILFCEKFVNRLDINAPPIPYDTSGDYLPQYRLIIPGGGVSLHVNRDVPPSGYWDYPIKSILREENLDLRPVCFFDWERHGWKMLEFYRVRIVNCPSHPELNDRDAIIPCRQVDIEVIEGLPEYKGEDNCWDILNLPE